MQGEGLLFDILEIYFFICKTKIYYWLLVQSSLCIKNELCIIIYQTIINSLCQSAYGIFFVCAKTNRYFADKIS